MYREPKTNFTGRRRVSAGFTLIELMISALLAAILLAAVFSGISSSFALLDSTREHLRATQIIMSRLEGMHLEAWGNANQPTQLFDPSLVPTTFTDYFYPQGLKGSTNEGTVYTGTITIYKGNAISTSYANSLALVVVSVSWSDVVRGVTNAHTDTMSTYIGQYGVQNYVYTH